MQYRMYYNRLYTIHYTLYTIQYTIYYDKNIRPPQHEL